MANNGFGAPGEDVYKYEEQQERQALLRSLHLPMKSWFIGLDPTFTAKFGAYPSFWQDLERWEHVKVMQKLYLAATETGDPGGINIFKLHSKLFPTDDAKQGSDLANNGTGVKQSDQVDSTDGVQVTKKRRNRWGDSDNSIEQTEKQHTGAVTNDNVNITSDVPTVSSADTGGDNSVPRKRRSRFSAAPSTDSKDPSTETTTVNSSGDGIGSGPVGAAAGFAAAAALAAKLGIGTASSVPPATSFLPPQPLVMPVITEEIMQQTMVLQMQLKSIGDRLMTVVADAAALENDPNRPPSPPPKYDSRGIRTNTREVRMREEYTQERTKVIEELLRINPMYQPPPDYVRAKPFKKVYIPSKEHPTYNFIGIIIGPRGNTQKRLEQETGTKISIRGKGSVKDGSKGRSKHDGPDENDELHVHVDGPTMETVEKACKLIEELLVVVDDDKNEHKQKQLRELALINGTLKEDEYCSVCAEKGHRHFECPQRTKSFKAAGVKCAICGDQSHPTRDCPLKNDAPTNEVVLDTEYDSFMAELGDGNKKADSKPTTDNVAGVDNGSTSVSEDDKVKISKTSSGSGVQQTVIHVKTLLTGEMLPSSSPSSTTQNQVPQSNYQYDPSQQYMQAQQQALYGAYQYHPHMQYDAYGYPMYPTSTSGASSMYPPNYDPYAYSAAPSVTAASSLSSGTSDVQYDQNGAQNSAPTAPPTSSFPPPPPGPPADQDMDMGD